MTISGGPAITTKMGVQRCHGKYWNELASLTGRVRQIFFYQCLDLRQVIIYFLCKQLSNHHLGNIEKIFYWKSDCMELLDIIS